LDIFFTSFFPSLLIIGTFILGWREIKSYHQSKVSGKPPGWVKRRFARRVLGLVIMLCIGVMIIVGGRLVPPASSPVAFMKFWLICIALVICVLVLAIWDAVCEIRKIKEYVDDFHMKEVQELKKKIKIYYN
jgi:hypothetical protein